MKRAWIAMVVLCGMSTLAWSAPQYKPVKAELVRPRGGLPNVLAKLEAGKPVRIAYFGGSITSMPGWRTMTLDWFKKTWPKSTVEQIHAAIGGTGSNLGAFRVQHDVIDKKPDLVFVEFAVNDGGAAPEAIWRQMDGIVRQIRQADPTIDICYVYTIHKNMLKDYKAGNCPRSASAMEMLADHYDIPSINPGFRVAQLEEQDKLIFTVKRDKQGKPVGVPEGKIGFSGDACHPLPAGHEVFTEVITQAILDMKDLGRPGPHKLGEPFVADHWTKARMVPIDRVTLSEGWKRATKDDRPEGRFLGRMPLVVTATEPGQTIRFRFRGSAAYLYDIKGPDAGQLTVTVDGKKRDKPLSRFDRYCSYWRMSMVGVARDLDPATVHEVVVEVHPEQPDRTSVLDRVKDKPGFDPTKYDGTVIRVGAVMLIGELVE